MGGGVLSRMVRACLWGERYLWVWASFVWCWVRYFSVDWWVSCGRKICSSWVGEGYLGGCGLVRRRVRDALSGRPSPSL